MSTIHPPAAPVRGVRQLAPDLLRGLIVMLMALDHVRDFFAPAGFDPTDLTRTDGFWFFTRWITHLCAPGFVLLAGVAAFLRAQKVGTAAQSGYLWRRGLLLIVLEVSWINFSWQFGFGLIVLQVIWALGVSMLALAACIHLPRHWLILLAALLILPHNLLDSWQIDAVPLWLQAWHHGGMAQIAGVRVLFLYPLMPWIGLMLAGYALGPLFLQQADVRQRQWLRMGLLLLLTFVLLRAGNWYGDPQPWSSQPQGAIFTVLSFLKVQKYPPSLLYLCATLGILFLLLLVAEKLPTSLHISRLLLLFGRHPLLFYCLHIAVLHAAGNAWLQWQYGGLPYRDAQGFHLPSGYTPSLLVCYLAWLLALLGFGLLLHAWERWQKQRAVLHKKS